MKEQKCRACGCTSDRACQPEACSWVKPNLCSVCYERELAELMQKAAAWFRTVGATTLMGAIAERPAEVTASAHDGIVVKDHLGVVVFALDQEGVSLAPHYDAGEIAHLFATEAQAA